MILKNISNQNIRCSTCCDDDLEEVIVELPVEVEREPACVDTAEDQEP